jgi:hypothetical protein
MNVTLRGKCGKINRKNGNKMDTLGKVRIAKPLAIFDKKQILKKIFG